MVTVLEILIGILAVGLWWWAIRKLLRPAEPVEGGIDPFAPVPAPLRPGPRGRAGAVALEEPEDDETPDAFPPRTL